MSKKSYNMDTMKKAFASISATILFLIPLFALVHSPMSAYAQAAAPAPFVNPIKYDNFSDFAAGVTQSAVQILMPFIVLAFIYSGFLFVKAQGKPKELEDAQNAIKWSIVGAFILFGAWGFAQIIKTTISTVTN